MKYLLDTSAIVHYLKFKSVYTRMEKDLSPFSDENTPLVSIVTLGELNSLALRNDWSDTQLVQLNDILSKCEAIPISSEIIKVYGEIDAFSQGFDEETEGVTGEPQHMGKNDLWIAATASSVGVKLITIDKDFSHLADNFLDLVLLSVRGKYLDPSQNT